MIQTFNLDALSNAFVEAAVDPARWDAAMDVAAKATRSFGAMLFDIKGHLPSIPRSREMGPSFEAYVRDGWIERDERYSLAPLMVRRGVVSELDVLTPEEIAKRPYYQEFLAPFGLRWYAGVKVSAGDELWCLSIQRSIQQGPFSTSEMRLLAELSKRLGSAAALARMLSFARAEGALDAFNVSGTPAVLLDRNAEVILVNEAADTLIRRDLRLRGRHLASVNRNATDDLERALHALLRNSTPAAMMAPVPLPRISGRPLLAYPLRLPRITSNALASCQAVIVLVDPDVCAQPPEVALRACFGLTSAEAKLAHRMSSGEGLEAAAERLRISYETARNQLKAIFAKTDTHRQAELVALLARLPNSTKVAIA
ncbi:helix-turn-helix transcriptional regulator [Mesorhizobium sp. M0991]|uniref:helix-turn-helix transcriptional regulator n=1 Tax=Mesorhizobium sp. M0991 TaxID=2957043 RepID=UPI003336C7FB